MSDFYRLIRRIGRVAGNRRSAVTRALAVTGVFGVLVGAGLSLVPAPTAVAAAGINKAVNFQGKFVNTDGTNVTNGTYNVEFKIYTGGDGCVPGGSSSSPCGGTSVWTEDWLNNSSHGVVVQDGLFQLDLGTINPLPNVFNTDNVWLSVNLGDTGSSATFAGASGDGEMLPFIRFTAAPYAINSDMLDGLDSSAFGQLQIGSPTAQTGTLDVTANLIAGTSVQAPLVDTATATTLSIGTGTASQVTIGRTSTPFLLQGNTSSTITSTSGGNKTTIGFDSPTHNTTLNFPASTTAGTYTICTTDVNSCGSVYAAGTSGSFLAKDGADTSSFAVTAANYLYGFTNSSSAVASGVLSLDNGTNTGNGLYVTASGNPGSGNALIVANNTTASPSGNLIDLQKGSASQFSVDYNGNVSQNGGTSTTDTVNGQTISSVANFTGTVTAATAFYGPRLDTASSGALTVADQNASSVNIGNTTNNIATTVSGTELVKPTATHDSATAFQVQTAGSVPLLTADTLNSKVIVQAVSDTAPALVVANSDGTAAVEIRAGGNGGASNTFVGLASGANNAANVGAVQGINNTGLGVSALHANTTGYANTALGMNSLLVNTTGYLNTAAGVGALGSNTTGQNNAAFGVQALNNNSTGLYNVAVGNSSLFNSTGNNNTAVGQSALFNSTGANNTALGYAAGGGAGVTSGDKNTFVGYEAGYQDDDGFTPTSGLQNAAAIGSNAQVQESNSLVLGGAGTDAVNVGIGTTVPLNTLSVSPEIYGWTSVINTTAYVASSGTTVTGVNSTWDSSMVGMEFTFQNGQHGIITSVTSPTSLDLDTSQAVIASGSAEPYRIQATGLQVTSDGKTGVGTYNKVASAPQLDVASGTSDTASTALTTSNFSGQVSGQFLGDGTVNLGGNGSVATYGLTTKGPSTNGGFNGMINGQRITTGAGGAVNSISTYIGAVDAPTNNLGQMAIYDDTGSNAPGAYVASTAVTALRSNSWNTWALSATLLPTHNYWLVYWTNENTGNGNQQYWNTGVTGSNWYFQTGQTFGGGASNGMPSSFPAGTLVQDNFQFSIFITMADSQQALQLQGSNGSAIFRNTSNSTAGFQVQNATGQGLLTVDTSGAQVVLGKPSAVDGKIVFDNHVNGNTASIFNDGNLHVDGNNNNLWLDGGNIYMNAGNSNKVAIGNSSPNHTLDVTGDIGASVAVITPLLGTASATDLNIESNSTNRITVKSGGEVDVNSGSDLHVLGGTISAKTASDSLTTPNLQLQTSTGNNLLTVAADSSHSRLGFNLGSTNLPTLSGSGVEINGALQLDGGATPELNDSFTTPAGTSGVMTKILIPAYDPGNFGQILAFGIPSSAASPASNTARAISLFDQRGFQSGTTYTATPHQPTINVLSPDENQLLGFSWEGLNSTGYVKTSADALTLRVSSNTTAGLDAVQIVNSGGNASVGIGRTPTTYALEVNGSAQATTSLIAPTLDTATAAALNIGATGTPTTTAIDLNQSTVLAAGKNFSTTSGAGTITQNYSATTGTGTTLNATDSSASGATTEHAQDVALAGNATSGSNALTGLNFNNVTTIASNTFTAINVGTGFNDLLDYNGTQLISGAGLVQNAAIDSSGNYSNLNKVGALVSGSIASGFGTISTGNNITTTATIQGGTINATTAYQANGTPGVGLTCASGDSLTGAHFSEGIITAGTCTTVSGGGGTFLAKNSADTSAAAITAGNYLYGFSNSSSAVASGVLKIDNATNTGSALYVTSAANAAANNALVLVTDTNASPSGNLLDLQSGSSPVSVFNVSALGVATLAGNQTADITVQAAAATSNGNTLTLVAGAGGSSGSHAGGDAILQAGAGTGTGLTGIGGTARVNGGAAPSGGAGGLVVIAAANGGSTAASGVGPGGSVTIQGGNATGSNNNNGGSISLTAGTATGTGNPGTVNIGAPVFTSVSQTLTQTANNQVFCAASGGSCTNIVAALQTDLDTDGTIVMNVAGAFTGATVTMPSPTNQVAGRIILVSAASGSASFTLAATGMSSVNMAAGSTATLIWNGTNWSGTTTASSLQQVYNNTSTAPASIITTSTTKNILFQAGVGDDNANVFQIGNSLAAPVLHVDTTNTATGANKAHNSGAETGTGCPGTVTGWSAFTGTGTATICQNISASNLAAGLGSVDVSIAGAGTGGVNNDLNSTALSDSQLYNVSFNIKMSSGFTGAPTIAVQYYRDATNLDSGGTCTVPTNGTPNSTSFFKYTCYFTTSGSGTPKSTANFLRISETDATGAEHMYIDNLFVGPQTTTGALNSGELQVGGPLSQGLTLFQLDSFANDPIAGTVNQNMVGSMYYSTTLGRIQCYESDGWGSCGAAPDSNLILEPEYGGAVLNPGPGTDAHIGTMTANVCSAAQAINSTICSSSGNEFNYYQWTTSQVTAQTYSIYVKYQLPPTFGGFLSSTTIQMSARVTSTTDADVDYAVYHGDGSECGTGTQNVTTSANTWQTVSYGTDPNACLNSSSQTYQPGELILFRVDMSSKNNADAYAGRIQFSMKGK